MSVKINNKVTVEIGGKEYSENEAREIYYKLKNHFEKKSKDDGKALGESMLKKILEEWERSRTDAKRKEPFRDPFEHVSPYRPYESPQPYSPPYPSTPWVRYDITSMTDNITRVWDA